MQRQLTGPGSGSACAGFGLHISLAISRRAGWGAGQSKAPRAKESMEGGREHTVSRPALWGGLDLLG